MEWGTISIEMNVQTRNQDRHNALHQFLISYLLKTHAHVPRTSSAQSKRLHSEPELFQPLVALPTKSGALLCSNHNSRRTSGSRKGQL